MSGRTPYPESGRAPAAAAPPQGGSLYEEMLRYQNENNIEDENDIIGARSRRKNKAGRSKSPPPPSDGTPSSRSTPTGGRRKDKASSGRRSPMNLSPSSSSDNRKKPGIVSIDQPAIHPNSVMYHAAYDNRRPAPAPAPPSNNSAPIVEATPIGLSDSVPVALDPTVHQVRSRTPTRNDVTLVSASAHGPRPSPKKPIIDALCVSAHNPVTRPLVSPLDPLSGSQHNPMFFASVDETMQTNQQTKKARGKSPMFDPLGFSQHKKTRSRSPHFNSIDSTTLDVDAAEASKKSKSRSKSPMLAGRSRKQIVPDDVVAPKANQSGRRGSTLVEEMPVISREDVAISTPVLPVFDKRRDPRQTPNKQTQSKSPPPRSDRSPTRNTPDQARKKPPPTDRPGSMGRAATTGSSDVPPTSSSTPTPRQMERSSSDQTPQNSRFARRTSTPQDQFDADLMLALELSQRDAQESSAPPSRAASPKQPPSVPSPRASPPAAAAKPAAAAAKRSQPVGLGDHFAKSEFAKDASKPVTDDESSLADVLLALKISAEEEAARKRGETVGKTMTSIQELLELEANERRRNDGSSDEEDEEDDDEEDEEPETSVMDLVAAGISHRDYSSSDAAEQQERYRRLQEEEQRQLELALKASEEALRSRSKDDKVDADVRLALEASRDEFDISDDEDFLLEQQRAIERFSAEKYREEAKKQAPLDHERGRNSLVERGTAETQRAINAGKAHIVTCRGCQAKLQAPIAYSLVFCPNCQTVSPTGM